MKIEILPDEQRKGVLHLSVEDGFYREIHTAIFGKRPKLAFQEGDLSEQFSEVEYKRARFFVLKRLSQRNYSSFELCSQLKERLVSSGTINRVVEECRQLGYIDDDAWLEDFVRRQKLGKNGPKMIASKLYQKGVPQSFYEPVLRDSVSHEDQKEGIQRILQTRFRSKDLSDFNERQKVFGALVRKGYDFEIVKEIVDLSLSE